LLDASTRPRAARNTAEQSAQEIQSGLELSAGAVSAATRMSISGPGLERTARIGDLHAYA
jgi:hypothetical protein